MRTSITLHPEYGVNPTVGVCFWCGEDDGTVGMLGLNKGKKAKHRTVLTLEPCKKCQNQMAQGITLIEATPYDSKLPELQPGAHVTGRWLVLREESEFFDLVSSDLKEDAMRRRKMLVEPELFRRLLPSEEKE